MSEHIADNIKAVFFDHDDTLVGTIGTKWEQHKHVARTFYGKEHENLSDEEVTDLIEQLHELAKLSLDMAREQRLKKRLVK